MRTRWSRFCTTSSGLVAITILVGACSTARAPSSEPLARSATAERDGVRLAIALDRNPMQAGARTSITSTVTNIGPDPVTWNLCAEDVVVRGQLDDAPWRPGRELAEPARTWKAFLLDRPGLADGPRSIAFRVDGHDGSSSGCGDVGHEQELKPGATFEQRTWWDGATDLRLGPPPSASVDLVGRFAYVRAGQNVPFDLEHQRTAEVHLPARVAGAPERLADPAEAVDAALADPRLAAAFKGVDLHAAHAGVVRFDAAAGTWIIGLVDEGAAPLAHLLTLDARTLAVIRYAERPWDFEVDGEP